MFIHLIFNLLLYLLCGFASSFSSDGSLADCIPQWTEESDVTTWLFDEGTFIPTAKIVGDKSCFLPFKEDFLS